MKPIIAEYERLAIEAIEHQKRLESRLEEPSPKGAKAKAKAKGKKKAKKKKKRRIEDAFEIQHFRIGDSIDVHYKIVEGEKVRIQIFAGTVIRKKGGGLNETFTVRRIVQGQGVERIFPLHSPKLMKVIVTRRARVRRAKLYYLRDRVGKATKTKELLGEKAHRMRRADEQRQKEGREAFEAELAANPPPAPDADSGD